MSQEEINNMIKNANAIDDESEARRHAAAIELSLVDDDIKKAFLNIGSPWWPVLAPTVIQINRSLRVIASALKYFAEQTANSGNNGNDGGKSDDNI